MQKRSRIAALMLASTACMVMGSMTLAQDGAPAEMDQDAMMQAYAEASAPGPMHELMNKGLGKWHVKGMTHMPDAESSTYEGTITRKPIFGGRYVEESWDIPDMMGFPFQGLAIMGFNNATGEFESTWIDSMSTGIFFSSGTYDESTQTLEMVGIANDPVMGKTKMRSVADMSDENTYAFKMYTVGDDGSETLTMEATAKRGGGDMNRNDNANEGRGKSEENKGKGKGKGNKGE